MNGNNMGYTTKKLAIEVYQQLFGQINKEAGFSIEALYRNYGVEVNRIYQRSSWVDAECDHSVFMKGGKVYGEKMKEIGTYKELE